jgi:hypothetical protein
MPHPGTLALGLAWLGLAWLGLARRGAARPGISLCLRARGASEAGARSPALANLVRLLRQAE